MLLTSQPLFSVAAPSGRVSPADFGRIFQENRAALVRVKARTDTDTWATGFLAGAQGEVIFGCRDAPAPTLAVTFVDGTTGTATLLGFDRDLGLGIARLVEPRPEEVVPLVVGGDGGFSRRGAWILALAHDERGRPEPFAGIVDGRTTAGFHGVVSTLVDIASDLGTPIVSTEGKLIGVAIEGGRRRSRIATIESLAPFLRKVVLGQASERDQRR